MAFTTHLILILPQVMVHQVPVVEGVALTGADLLSFVWQLERTAAPARLRPNAVQQILNSKACRGAVMFGSHPCLLVSA